MTDPRPAGPRRTVQVSPKTLEELYPTLPEAPAGNTALDRLHRCEITVRVGARRQWVAFQFRLASMHKLRCRLVEARLRVRLTLLRLRNVGRIQATRLAKPVEP